MTEILSPGVYIQEVSGGPKPIEAVSTSTACFIGFTERATYERVVDGVRVPESVHLQPFFVTSWLQYRETFGDLVSGIYTPQSVYGFFQNGGRRCYVVSLGTIPPTQGKLLSSDGKHDYLTVRAKQAALDSRLRVRVEADPLPDGSRRTTNGGTGGTAGGATAGQQGQSGTAADGAANAAGGNNGAATNGATAATTPEKPYYFHLTVEREVKINSDRWKKVEEVRQVTLQANKENKLELLFFNNQLPKNIDLFLTEAGKSATLQAAWPKPDNCQLITEQGVIATVGKKEYDGDLLRTGNETKRTGLVALSEIDDISIICAPDLMVTPLGQTLDRKLVKALQTTIIDHCKNMGDRVAIVDTPPYLTPQEAKDWRMNEVGYDTSYAAVYYPWIEVWDSINNRPMNIPPSGYMAGIWARNDTPRGVHKAPANEIVNGAIGLAYNTTTNEQDILNPIGVNCIRAFPGMGIRVWGARTMSLSDPEWRYLNVRRLFNMIEKSIQRSTMWAVFEPNDWRLWSKLRRDVSNFLMGLYSQGMLFGRTAGEAFFVQVDESNNPSYSRDLGFLYVDVGVSPVKPAEFIVFRIRQWSGEPPAQG
jgi:phage tail sheath protein FI